MLSDEKNILTSAYAQWSGWFNIVQNIRIGNFWFWQLLWVQLVANIRPLNNSYHFNTFDHNYWEIICLELWQNWVETTYLTILCDEQFQKKVDPNSCFPYWEGSSWCERPQFWVASSSTGSIDHEMLDFLVFHKVK